MICFLDLSLCAYLLQFKKPAGGLITAKRPYLGTSFGIDTGD